MYTVYVLKSEKDGKHYIGYTSDVSKRLQEHNSGKTISTRWRRPFVVIYCEEFESIEEAKSREKYLKSGKGREELKELFNGAVPHPPSAGKSGKGEYVYSICFEKRKGWKALYWIYIRCIKTTPGA